MHRLVRSLVPALCLGMVASVLAFATSASADATVTVGAVLKTDGTATFDLSAGPGNDVGPNNGIVRTFDYVTYGVTIGNSGQGNDINHATVSRPCRWASSGRRSTGRAAPQA